jgi:hypothetical protein
MICAIDRFSIAHQSRKQTCAIDERRLREKSISQEGEIDLFPIARQSRNYLRRQGMQT